MKKFLFLAGLFMAVTTASAQSGNLDQGRLQLNAGVGISGWGIPLYVGLDYGVTNDISVGGEFTFRSYSHSSYYTHNIMGFFGNGNYHFNNLFNLPRPLDLYAGLSLGVYTSTVTAKEGRGEYYGDSYSGFSLIGQTGARYFFTDNFGVNLELSGGLLTSGAKAGITYRF
ncbi:hypothetical protein [Capnocytophaga granulosa]|jgi:hypothetical protein|uniref:hypothetical protein n=1 Tax=Capnocytophaga granulosa TaxID=45242 RepID=UPI0028D0D9D0|nr:hypothetical protein [Capnocytophaga granulosa]